MKQAWIQGLDATQEEDIRGSYTAAFLVRQRMELLLGDRITASNKQLASKNLFESPNWALVQAEGRGYERALHEIVQLLK